MKYLDNSMDDSENTRFLKAYHELIRHYSLLGQFTSQEVSCILMVYFKLVESHGTKAKCLTVVQFTQLFVVMFNIYDLHTIDRTILHISKGQKYVDQHAWMQLISVFMTRDLHTRMKFAFAVYNEHGTGYLNLEIVSNAVEKFFTGEDEDDMSELRGDMIEIIMSKFDLDKDGLISYEEYESVVTKQPQLVEFLGRVFPTETDVRTLALCLNVMTRIPT